MSQVVARPYEPRDAQALYRVWQYTCNSGEPYAPEKQVLVDREGYVCEIGGEIVGGGFVLDMTATRGPSLYRNGGVAAIAVLPEARSAGVGSVLMPYILRSLKAQGRELSSLYAFRETFYRKFGYESCGKRIKIGCPSQRMPNLQAELPAIRIEKKDWRRVEECCRAFAHARSGMGVRNDMIAMRHFGEGTDSTLYAIGDPAEAYVLISHKIDFWVDQEVKDIGWSTARGYRSILAFLRSVGINKTGLTWYEPSDSPFVASYTDQGIDLKVERPIMFRALDVPALLRGLRTRSEGEFTLGLIDELFPENCGPWRVSFCRGGVTVEACDSATLTMDVRQFVQAFLGEPSLIDVMRNGWAVSTSESELDAAFALLTPNTVYCNDFF